MGRVAEGDGDHRAPANRRAVTAPGQAGLQQQVVPRVVPPGAILWAQQEQ